MDIGEIVKLILLYLPSYIGNASPVICNGKTTFDSILKTRLFGNNKTVKGFLCGIISSTITAIVLSNFIQINVIDGIKQGIGVMLGDLTGSLIKRRIGIKEGMPFFLDPFLFIIFSMALTHHLWRDMSLISVLTFIIFTAITHRITNIVAFMLKIKNKPW